MFIHFVQAYFKILLVGDSLLIFYVKISESCKCAGMRFHCANGLVVLRGVVLKKEVWERPSHAFLPNCTILILVTAEL